MRLPSFFLYETLALIEGDMVAARYHVFEAAQSKAELHPRMECDSLSGTARGRDLDSTTICIPVLYDVLRPSSLYM